MYSKDTESNKMILDYFGKEFQLNVFIGTVMNHLIYVFRHFKKIVIKDNQNKGWVTTDNPVYINRQDNNQWLVPIEAEIYFPLSKDFCLFMYHPNSELNSNPLRKLRSEKINTISFEEFDKISMNIGRNFFEYIIFCNEIEPTIIEINTTTNSGLTK